MLIVALEAPGSRLMVRRGPVIDRLISKFEIPKRLRAVVRARESSLIALAAVVGAIAGLVVTAMSTGVDTLHRLLFHLEPGVRLSGLLRLDPVLARSSGAGGRNGKSIRSKPTPCMAAACRSSAA
jgi:hypothetical protein